jgi:hypothetical protein
MKKIALCFLTYGNLSQPELWNRVIKNNSEKVNVYIHNKTNFVDQKYNLDRYCITNREHNTSWANISLIRATLRLFEEAYKNTENVAFILLSDKCIPLYNFDYIYNRVFSINTNMLQNAKVNWSVRKRYDLLHDKEFFSLKDMAIQSQWCIFNRDTIRFFIENDYTSKFGEESYCPDEHYFIMIMKKFDINYTFTDITYFNREEKSDNPKRKPYPKMYDILTNDETTKIINTTTCLFMRKISDKCILPSYFESIK